MFDPLPDDLEAALEAASARLGAFAAVHFRAEVDSTNDVALSMAAAGAPEGTSVIADVQRKGRGRRGHEWYSPAGTGLYLSVVVRPDMSYGAPSVLTLGAGVAMAAAVRETTGLPVELKWPNDVVIDRPRRKLGGVLAEAVSAGSSMKAVVVGMGLNVGRMRSPVRLAGRATSIEEELGRFIDRAALTVELLAELRQIMVWVHAGDRARVIARWRAFAWRALGGPVRWSDELGAHQGIARDVDEDGALLVVTRHGDRRIVAGEVIWEDGTGE